jgi:hypothetical protein
MTRPRRELSPADTKEQARAPIDGAGEFEESSLDCGGDDEFNSAISRRRLDGWKLHTALKMENGRTRLIVRREISR